MVSQNKDGLIWRTETVAIPLNQTNKSTVIKFNLMGATV